MLENIKDVISANELYDILPIGKNNIYKLLNTNVIKSIRVGNRILIPKQNVIDFLMASNN